MPQIKVLFVCMGNICRSPTAEGVFRHLVTARGMAEQVTVDSAGTHDYHIGAAPDVRAQTAAARRGYDLAGLRARQVEPKDIGHFDYVLAMDEENLATLRQRYPMANRDRMRLFLEFAEDVSRLGVPDPYYGVEQDFETMLDLVENAARGLLRYIEATPDVHNRGG